METARHARRAGRHHRRKYRDTTRRATWRAVIGAALVLAGVAMLADRIGWVDVGSIWNYWPLIPIGVGAIGLMVSRPSEWSGPFWVLMAGVYCAVSHWGLWGLSWMTAWPIFFVAAGIVMLFEIFFGREEDEESEKEGPTDA